jgi:hypothetical protein
MIASMNQKNIKRMAMVVNTNYEEGDGNKCELGEEHDQDQDDDHEKEGNGNGCELKKNMIEI